MLPSWLGSGTSTLAFFIAGGVPGPPATRPGVCEAALVLRELDIQAAAAGRKGRRAEVGLAVGHNIISIRDNINIER